MASVAQVCETMKKVVIADDNETNETSRKTAVFRYKLEPHIVEAITLFAKIHEHNDRHEYKDSWKEWCEENNVMLDKEAKRLENLGFTGDAYDKFFKSGRYYFRNKKAAKVVPVERKKYVGLNRDTLRMMDSFISKISENDANTDNKTSPAKAFNQFCDDHKEELAVQIESLVTEENMEINDINNKLKKTFKNRYFQKMKKMSN